MGGARSAVMPAALLACALLIAAAGGATAQTVDVDPAGFYNPSPVPGLRIPAFPNNILIFTGRDFVHVDAYTQYKGKNMRVEVVDTSNTVIGAAICQVSGADTAFEINHPGGYCWGDGLASTDPLSKVTPAIENGHKVRLLINGDIVGEMIAADCGGLPETPLGAAPIRPPSAQSSVRLTAPDTVTITGYSKVGLNEDGAEVRIVQPDLTATAVGKRDIRVNNLGPVRAAGLVSAGSILTFTDYAPGSGPKATGYRKFTATFQFDNTGGAAADMADLALNGIPSITFAAYTDANANAVALTLQEFLEPGGAGTGLCPPGPAIAPPSTGVFTTSPVTSTSLRVDWTEPVSTAQTSPRVGFHVLAMGAATSTVNGPTQAEIGQYIASTSAKSTIVTGLTAGAATYTVAVRSQTQDGRLSLPFELQAPTTTSQTGFASVSASVSANKVVLTPDPAGTPIYVTSSSTGDTVPAYTEADGLAPSAVLYDPANKPLIIPAGGFLDVSWVVFAGTNAFPSGNKFSTAAAPAVVGAPTISGTAGQASVSLSWTAVPNAVDYTVKLYLDTAPTAGTAPSNTIIGITDKFRTVNGLTPGKTYYATVAGRNSDGVTGDVSAASSPLLVQSATDKLTLDQNQWKVGDWRLSGTSTDVPSATNPAARIYICMGGPCGTCGTAAGCPAGVTLVPSSPVAVQAPVAPALPTWTLRLTNGQVPATDPRKVWLLSSKGGTLGGTAAEGLPTTAGTQKGRRLLQA